MAPETAISVQELSTAFC